MTSRRSIRTGAERTSRAFQFIPGHVGGRVASAQPVQRRRTVGTSERPLVELVDWYSYNGYTGLLAGGTGNWWLDYSDLDLTAADGDRIVAFVAGNGYGFQAPAGWTVLDSQDFTWSGYVLAHTVKGGTTSFDFPVGGVATAQKTQGLFFSFRNASAPSFVTGESASGYSFALSAPGSGWQVPTQVAYAHGVGPIGIHPLTAPNNAYTRDVTGAYGFASRCWLNHLDSLAPASGSIDVYGSGEGAECVTASFGF